MKKLIPVALLLIPLFLTGCSFMIGMSVKNNKGFITWSDGGIETCSVSSSGVFENCTTK